MPLCEWTVGGYRVVVYEGNPEDGDYWAEEPTILGCVAQGKTLAEVKRKAQKAIEVWIAMLAKDAQNDGQPVAPA